MSDFVGCGNFIEQSLCGNCYYRLSKEIRPIEGSAEEWSESIGEEVDENTIIEIHCCLLLQMDLDHVVLKCNKYVPNSKADFLNNLNRLKPQ